MGINIRAKGQVGEREIADDLNAIITVVRAQLGLPALTKPQVQRNQQQSAVGGCDLVGTYGFAIEVKRQETLSINSWWAQCLASAKALNGIPVLLFRQNAKPGQRTKWRCITVAEFQGATAQSYFPFRVELDYDDFKEWFRWHVRANLRAEHPELDTRNPAVPLPPVQFAMGG
jgi:hypothetical protein